MLLMTCSAFAQQALWGGASVESPVVNEDGTVTFRYQAPKAVKVTVSGDFLPTQKMTFKMGDQEMSFDSPGVGELKEEREQNITMEIVRMQTKVALLGVSEAELDNIIIAYEPVWAIGTGLTATAEQANEVNGAIRALIGELYGKAAADKIVVQYGGSMNAGNADELLAQYDVDGGLIGGASLKAADFAAIVKAASK